MKILQMIPAFYPALAYGGTVKVAYDLSKELARRGHEVTVYTSDSLDKYSRQKDRFVEMNGIQVYYFRNLSNTLAWHRLVFTPGMLLQLGKEAKNFDIVHLHGFRNFPNIVAHHYAMKFHIPYVFQAHGDLLPLFAKRKLKRVYDVLFGHKILRDAAKVIPMTKLEIDEYKNMGTDEDKITLIPPPYEVNSFAHLPAFGQFRERFGIKEKHIILSLARIHKIKGIDFLVESFYELAQERDDVALVIAGPDDGHQSALESLIQKLDLSTRVLFTGLLGGQDKLSALVDATMLVQTSIFERAPGSPFEAILCNTPIIVTRDTGCGEIVAELDAGYLVRYGNANELRDLMQRILDDPAEARDKAQKGKQYILENLSWQIIIKEYERLYQSVIERRRAS